VPIHEKSLIRPEDLTEHEKLEIDGVDVSGHWSTFINARVVNDYNERLEEEIAALPGGEFIHRCWQCASCTNVCTVNALNPDFNPRYWIYLARMGYESELVRDKDLIWQCVSCHKCTHVCPRDVVPEGVMKAMATWMELKGHTEAKPSAEFDAEFTEQIAATGKIEEGRIIRGFFKRTGQPLRQRWLLELARRLALKLPILMGVKMALAQVFRPRTKDWGRAKAAIDDYLLERDRANRTSLDLD
jgi:heterodisulfide reductase subunit C